MDSLGKRIKHLRQQKRMNQDEIAELMQKKGKQVVSNWENDKAEPSISDLRRLAEILGTTAAWLMDGDTSISVVSEPPAGFTMVPTSEFIELQRQVIKQQKDELQKQK